MYSNLGQPARSREYLTKAYQLRKHASEREKLSINAGYFEARGEIEKEAQEIEKQIRDAIKKLDQTSD